MTAETLSEEGFRRPQSAAPPVDERDPARSALVAGPVLAIVLKDLRYVWRDSLLASQMAVPMILFLVPFVALSHPALRAGDLTSVVYVMAAVLNAIVVFMQTSILSLSSIGLESRSAWILLAAPIGGPTIVWAKFLMSALVCASIGVVLGGVSSAVFGAPAWVAALQCTMAAVASVGLCGLGVGLSACLPRFLYENPAHRVSPWAMIFGFVGAMLYCALAAAIVAGTAFGALTSPDRGGWIYALGILALAALTSSTAMAPLIAGARRLNAYEWVH